MDIWGTCKCVALGTYLNTTGGISMRQSPEVLEVLGLEIMTPDIGMRVDGNPSPVN